MFVEERKRKAGWGRGIERYIYIDSRRLRAKDRSRRDNVAKQSKLQINSKRGLERKDQKQGGKKQAFYGRRSRGHYGYHLS